MTVDSDITTRRPASCLSSILSRSGGKDSVAADYNRRLVIMADRMIIILITMMVSVLGMVLVFEYAPAWRRQAPVKAGQAIAHPAVEQFTTEQFTTGADNTTLGFIAPNVEIHDDWDFMEYTNCTKNIAITGISIEGVVLTNYAPDGRCRIYFLPHDDRSQPKNRLCTPDGMPMVVGPGETVRVRRNQMNGCLTV